MKRVLKITGVFALGVFLLCSGIILEGAEYRRVIGGIIIVVSFFVIGASVLDALIGE